jgi:hypothetical protein
MKYRMSAPIATRSIFFASHYCSANLWVHIMPESDQSKLQAALETLRSLDIAARGPFVTPTGQYIYLVDGCVLTKRELLALHERAKSTPQSIQLFLDGLKSRQRAPRDVYPPNHRRSQRVMLRLNVLIRFEVREGNRQQTHAFTITVNAHGGLLESPFRMALGQGITLINPQTGKEVGCTVIGVHASSQGYFTVAFEFAQPSPRFWEIAFPPSDWSVSKEPA